MRRREFIALLGSTAVGWPLAARGQQPEPMRRIGVLMNSAADDPDGQARLTGFLQGLQEFGWTAGRNVRIDYRWVKYDDDRRRYAAELVALTPDVIMASASANVALLQQASRTVPIVFAAVTVMRLFEALHAMFVKSKGADLPSAKIIKHLNSDKAGEWFEYGGRGRPITQRQVAVVLKPHGIRPMVNHPDRTKSERGYKLAQFGDVFRRYLPHLPPLARTCSARHGISDRLRRKRKHRAKKTIRRRAV